MKLKAQIGEHERSVTIDDLTGNVAADIDGRRYVLEVRESSEGNYLLIHDTRVFRCSVDPNRQSRTQFDVTVNGRHHDATIIDPKRLRGGQATGSHGHGAAEIVSPMPGKVVRVLVENGQQVEAGVGIVVVEAMKMQNEMKSPKAGVVAQLNAEAGATVSAGEVLAIIE